MPDDYDYGGDSEDFSYQPSTTFDDSSTDLSYQPQSRESPSMGMDDLYGGETQVLDRSLRPQDYSMPIQEQSVPTFIPNGIDAKVAAITRQQQALSRQRPVYRYGNSFVAEPVAPTGTFIPIRGDVEYSGGSDQISYQQQQIEELEKQKPRFSDSMIMAQGGKIMQDLLATSPTGKLDNKGFYENPYWDQLRATGTSEDTIKRVQSTTLHAIKNPLKQMAAQQAYGQLVQDALIDNPYAPDFLQSRGVDPATGQPIPNGYEQILKTRPGSPEAKKVLKMFQDRQLDLDDNPEHADEYRRLKESQSPDDKATLNRLLATRNVGAFSNFLNSTIKNTAVLEAKHTALINNVDAALEETPGEHADYVRAEMRKMINDKAFDKGNEHLISLWTKKLMSDPGENGIVDFSLQTKDENGNPITRQVQMPSLYWPKQEKAVLDQLTKLKESGIDPSNVLIGVSGKGSRATPKVYTGEEKDKFIEEDIEQRYGDTKLKGDGMYVKIDADRFVDAAGNKVFLNIPSATDPRGAKGQVLLPTTFTYKGEQYVNREALTKIGLTTDILKDNADPDDRIQISAKFNAWLKGKATEYQPIAISGKEFLDDDLIKTATKSDTADGNRFLVNKAYVEHLKALDVKAKENSKNQMAWTEIPKDDPTFVAETGKGFAKGLLSLVTAPAALGWGVGTSLDSLVRGIYAKASGDDKKAAELFGHLNPLTEITEAHKAFEEASEGGFLHLDKLNADPRATGYQKAGAFAGNVVGSLLSVAGEVKLLDTTLKLPALAAKMTDLGWKLKGYDTTMSKLMTLARTGAATADQLKTLSMQRQSLAIIKGTLDWMGLALLHGEQDPAHIAAEGVKGAFIGKASQIGTGITMKQWRPSASRLLAAGAVAPMAVGLDSLRLLHEEGAPDKSAWDLRPDGTVKGTGWLGVIPGPKGSEMSEFSVSTDFNGGRDFPLIIPTTTPAELDIIRNLKEGEQPPKEMILKAEAFARKRVSEGKSPFATDSESPRRHKSREKLMEMYKDPEYWANIAVLALFPVFGSHGGKDLTPEKKTEAKREMLLLENKYSVPLEGAGETWSVSKVSKMEDKELVSTLQDMRTVRERTPAQSYADRAKGRAAYQELMRRNEEHPSPEGSDLKKDVQSILGDDVFFDWLTAESKTIRDKTANATARELLAIGRSITTKEESGVPLTPVDLAIRQHALDLLKKGDTKTIPTVKAQSDADAAKIVADAKAQKAKPVVPSTPAESNRENVLETIRNSGARTTEQVQKLFPKRQLSREEAARLRKQAWQEKPVIGKMTQAPAKAEPVKPTEPPKAEAPKPTEVVAAPQTPPPSPKEQLDQLLATAFNKVNDAAEKAKTVKAPKPPPVQKPSLRAQRSEAGKVSEKAMEKGDRDLNMPPVSEPIQGADGSWTVKVKAPEGVKYVKVGEKGDSLQAAQIRADEYRKANYGKVSMGKAMVEAIPQPKPENPNQEIYDNRVLELEGHVAKGVDYHKLVESAEFDLADTGFKAADAVLDAATIHGRQMMKEGKTLDQVNSYLRKMEMPEAVRDQVAADLHADQAVKRSEIVEKLGEVKQEERDKGC